MVQIIIGQNDLGTTHPELAAEWHPTKNGAITPQDVTRGSGLVIYWQCKAGHEWKSRIIDMSLGRRSCAACKRIAKRIAYPGDNNIGTNPERIAQLHPANNGVSTPQISSRGHQIFVENNLGTTHPELAAEWHPTKNNGFTPQEVTRSSEVIIHWQCAVGHEWKAKIYHRVARKNGCSACAKISYLKENNLGVTHPELAAEWHPAKNWPLIPADVTRSSTDKAHWMCDAGHEWESRISSRVERMNNCSDCRKITYLKENNLWVTHPELAAEWHPAKNWPLTPVDVLRSSQVKVHWQCAAGHEWETKIYNRVVQGSSCTECKKIAYLKDNNLGLINPELAAEWHPAKNWPLTPADVTQFSERIIYWMCNAGHEWEASVFVRWQRSGCPKCYKGSVGITENKFREALNEFSEYEFKSYRIGLTRLSRKSGLAQIDMLNKDLMLAIEYDGEWTHGANGPEGKTLAQKLAEDKETTHALLDTGYKVIRIREHSRDGFLPFVPITSEYESRIFQITYKSFGKDRDKIDDLARKIFIEKNDWFKQPTN